MKINWSIWESGRLVWTTREFPNKANSITYKYWENFHSTWIKWTWEGYHKITMDKKNKETTNKHQPASLCICKTSVWYHFALSQKCCNALPRKYRTNVSGKQPHIIYERNLINGFNTTDQFYKETKQSSKGALINLRDWESNMIIFFFFWNLLPQIS